MASLKAFCTELAEVIHLSPVAIYERQRALVRSGVFPEPTSRGRGHGLEASPETVATIMISLLGVESFKDTGDRVRALMRAKYAAEDRSSCPVTGASNFGGAMIAIFKSEEIANQISKIEVSRTSIRARIFFRLSDGDVDVSRFGKDGNARAAIEIDANLTNFVLRHIRETLKRVSGEDAK